eukprot:TRINITY_DN14604_c0_g1_i1.p1 TRINITY_DN14604_c0_g1~~TRINITY_DN14604_c0_g1_i1.p1  ORF type:complete len:211 (-),score=62.28 TRINITY_DN14604_c0_g1_i1:110-742(-)
MATPQPANGILYACVAEGKTIVAQHGDKEQFKKVAKVILERIPNEDIKKSYVHQSYAFNYISQKGRVFLCVTSTDFQTRVAFAYLQKIQGEYRPSGDLDFEGVLQREANVYGGGNRMDKVKAIQKEIDSVKDIMMENIDHVLKRGERLEDLMNKTDEMANEADQFRRGATKLKNAMWWKNVRLMIILAVVVIIIILIIIFSVCGITFKNC